MKKSRYNYFTERNGETIIYNVKTDAMGILDLKLKELYEKNMPEEIEQIHPDFYVFLREKGFLVENDTNELEQLKEEWTKSDTDNTYFSLTINPTLNCNMRCWYCYEEHKSHSNMTDNTYKNILKLLDSKLTPELKQFDLCFFGGEPLIGFDKIIYPAILYSQELCQKNNIIFNISFVTNGYLLDNRITEILSQIKTQNPIVFQITLDGNEYYHNQTRKTASGAGSYSQILKNIKNILRYDMRITLRFNYTTENINSFIDVVSDLSELTTEEREKITIDIHRVWQDRDKKADKIVNAEQRIREIFQNEKFRISQGKKIEKYRCYADAENQVTVNSDGNLFRCTARDFIPANSEGYLSDNGDLMWNEKSKERTALKWGNSYCQECFIYPLCHGSCSQNKIENKQNTGCYWGYDLAQQKDIIEKRVDYLIHINFINNK